MKGDMGGWEGGDLYKRRSAYLRERSVWRDRRDEREGRRSISIGRGMCVRTYGGVIWQWTSGGEGEEAGGDRERSFIWRSAFSWKRTF